MIAIIALTFLSLTASAFILQFGNYLKYKNANGFKSQQPATEEPKLAYAY